MSESEMSVMEVPVGLVSVGEVSVTEEPAEENAAEAMGVEEVEVSGFAKMGLDPRLMKSLDYKEPSPIQREAIPVLLEGKDLVGLAGTGTGKTAAFALPLLHRLRAASKKKPGVAALILTPTRELAIQIARAVKTYGKLLKADVLAIYGGTGYGDQIKAIRNGAEIIVATPGRALDLIQRGKLPLDTVKTVVLDEADEMLNMGFAEDMDAILSATPSDRQTMLFSATMPPRIEEIAQRHLRQPVRIQVANELPLNGEAAKIRQVAYFVSRENKPRALARILDVEQPTSAIIFCRTRSDTDELVDVLAGRGFKPLALHGGLTQTQRDQVMGRFRSGSANLLIATDIAARGLDISHLSHVINYELPTDPDQYVHRIGRVGRAGRAGVAITLATTRERSALSQIERAGKLQIPVAPVPTARDLSASRLDRTRAQLVEALAKTDGQDDLRQLVGELANEFTATDIAVAALSLLRQPGRSDDEADIPVEGGPREFRKPKGNPRSGFGEERPSRGGRRVPNRNMAKIYFGIGRESGVGARDLVGAIANLTGIPGKSLGAIDLAGRFSLVEVPRGSVDSIVDALQGVKIRGRKVLVRPDRLSVSKSEERVPMGA